MTTANTTAKPQSYGLRKQIQQIKDQVSIADYLADQGIEVKRNRSRCPIHRGDNPDAFAIYEDGRRWRCFRCDQGGDLIDLCELVERHADVWTAVIALAERYGVELWERPPRWFGWQDDKARIREAAVEAVGAVYLRRLTRLYAPLVVTGRETPADELAALEEIGAALWPVALDLARKRVTA